MNTPVAPDAVRAAIRSLLERRGPGKTICPSEAARDLTPPGRDWRVEMSRVHQAVAVLRREGKVVTSWKDLERSPSDGPYRIAMADWNER